jgi:hypothetical protein
MIVKVMYEKSERFQPNFIDEVTLSDANNDPHKVKSIILAKVKDLGLCYDCRGKLDRNFAYQVQNDHNIILFCCVAHAK